MKELSIVFTLKVDHLSESLVITKDDLEVISKRIEIAVCALLPQLLGNKAIQPTVIVESLRLYSEEDASHLLAP